MSFQRPGAAGGGNARPRLPLGIQPISTFPDRHTYSCHEYCLRIWFCALCLGPTAQSLDAFVVGWHIRCLSEPTCPRCQELVGRSLQKIPGQGQDIFTQALHKGLLMMKTVMALAWDTRSRGCHSWACPSQPLPTQPTWHISGSPPPRIQVDWSADLWASTRPEDSTGPIKNVIVKRRQGG